MTVNIKPHVTEVNFASFSQLEMTLKICSEWYEENNLPLHGFK